MYNKQGNNFKCCLKNLKKARAIWETVTLCSFANSVGLAFGSSQKIYFDRVLKKEINHNHNHKATQQ